MKTYSVSEAKKKNSIISEEDFNIEYQESINNPESFWQKKAEETLDWFSSWDEVTASYLEAGEVAWFKTGKLNANAAAENGEFPFFTCSRYDWPISYSCSQC